jgi:hypothetical protein
LHSGERAFFHASKSNFPDLGFTSKTNGKIQARRGKEKSPPLPPSCRMLAAQRVPVQITKTSKLLYVEQTGFSNVRMMLKDYLWNSIF